VAVLRGLDQLVGPQPLAATGAAAILRTGREDLFSHGSREAVLAALCRALGVPEAYAELVGADPDTAAGALLARAEVPADPAELVRRLLDVAQRLGSAEPTVPPG
jgi:coenzyme F420-0:L-glutamate ligase/coenzyme F420-1:gamma-L-glutamate ligase